MLETTLGHNYLQNQHHGLQVIVEVLKLEMNGSLYAQLGYNNGDIDPTEILSSPILSNNNFDLSNKCNWKNFRFNQNKINFCIENDLNLDIVLYNLQGGLKNYLSKKNTQKAKMRF